MTGILGGAFDPIHNEHMRLAEAAVRELSITRLVLLPTFSPPHKSASEMSFSDRVRILEDCFKSFSVPVVVSDIEERSGFEKSYSSEILRLLISELKNDGKLRGAEDERFVYIIGGDSFEKFFTWHKPEEILKTVSLAVAEREGYDPPHEVLKNNAAFSGADIKILDFKGKDISSSVVRAKLLLGLHADIPAPAEEYIKNHGLFSRYRDMQSAVKKLVSEERYQHVLSAVVTAVDINEKCGLKLSFDSVFTAALLHDAGKDSTKYRKYAPADAVGTKVEHQFEGAEMAARDFGVSDKDIIAAIRTHTTGAPDMSTLQKLIYIADMVEPLRDQEFGYAKPLRALVYLDFEGGFKAGIEQSYAFLKTKNSAIYPLTEDAFKFYFETSK